MTLKDKKIYAIAVMLIAVLAMAFHKEMILALDKVFDIMSPITMAILMALILDPYMAWICNHLPLKDQKVKIAVSTTITYILMLLIVGSTIIIIGPRLTKSILDFAGNFPNMLKNLETFINTNINGLDINENAINDLMQKLQGDNASYICDFSDVAGIEALVKKIVREHGAIDGLAFCVGVGMVRPIKMSKYEIEKQFGRIQ